MMQALRFDLDVDPAGCASGMVLEQGGRLPGAFLAYRTLGTLAADRGNAILVPSYYSGSDASHARLVGPGKLLDPDRHFLIFTNMLGNGVSTSPSNARPIIAASRFPRLMIGDMVHAQIALLRHLGIDRLAMAYGWSMGAMQSLHLAAMAPGMVARVLAVCGTARCWPGNQVFLQGVRAALTADPVFANGDYTTPPVAGLRAFGRVYAGWAYSPAFYRDALYAGRTTPDLPSFLRAWEDDHVAHDANDLLAILDAWHDADPARSCNTADWQAALARIAAHCVIMPCTEDKYFTPEEAALEAGCIAKARLETIASPYGHCAGAPGRYAEPTAQINAAGRALLALASD